MNENENIIQDEKNTENTDTSTTSLDNEAFISKLNEDLENQKKQAKEYYDCLRANMAEFDNFKKRINKEKESMYTNITADVISGLLPIIDNFENAVKAECTDSKYKEGIDLIYKSLLELLAKHNVEKIPDLGTTFDATYHEAVMSVQDEAYGEKEIVEVFRTGYRLKDKVVRHSLVKVAN